MAKESDCAHPRITRQSPHTLIASQHTKDDKKRPPAVAALPFRLRFSTLRKLEPFVGNAKPYFSVERIYRLLGELQSLLGLLPVSRGIFGHDSGLTVHRSVRLSANPVCRRSAWGRADHNQRIAKRVEAYPWSA